jgi:hypothetical protein
MHWAGLRSATVHCGFNRRFLRALPLPLRKGLELDRQLRRAACRRTSRQLPAVAERSHLRHVFSWSLVFACCGGGGEVAHCARKAVLGRQWG